MTPKAFGVAGGKSEHHTAACRVKYAGAATERSWQRKVSQKTYRRFFEKSAGKGEKARLELTARGVIREARKTPCGARQNRGRAAGPINPRVRRIMSRDCGMGIRPACGTSEMNDHPAPNAFGARQNSAYRHRNYEGRFRKRRRPSTFCDKNMSVGANGLADLRFS